MSFDKFKLKKLLKFMLLIAIISSCSNTKKQYFLEDTQIETEALSMHEHIVGYRGETLALIAHWYTGETANWKVIRDVSNIDIYNIEIGDIINIPFELITNYDPLPKSLVDKWVQKEKEALSAIEAAEETTSETLPLTKAVEKSIEDKPIVKAKPTNPEKAITEIKIENSPSIQKNTKKLEKEKVGLDSSAIKKEIPKETVVEKEIKTVLEPKKSRDDYLKDILKTK